MRSVHIAHHEILRNNMTTGQGWVECDPRASVMSRLRFIYLVINPNDIAVKSTIQLATSSSSLRLDVPH